MIKKWIAEQIKKSIIKQKNEWPATSVPVFFQPTRPQKSKEQHNKNCK